MHHDLKLAAKYFAPIIVGIKRSEVRQNDRNYKIGDTITLHEGWPGLDGFEYTGRTVSARISYIDGFGCQQGYVSLSLADVGLLIIP